MNYFLLGFEKLGLSKKKLLSIILLLTCIFISLYLSDIPFIVNMQNKNYYNKFIMDNKNIYGVLSERGVGEYKFSVASKGKEGMADMSANNIISDIINDSPNAISQFEQLSIVKKIAQMGTYSQTNKKMLMDIIDSSGNSDSTKINNLNRFINTYVSGSPPSKNK